jgi:hypothetical protein
MSLVMQQATVLSGCPGMALTESGRRHSLTSVYRIYVRLLETLTELCR